MSRAIVIGISGVTCGGKSSLTRMLKNIFPHSAVICQDDFYHTDPSLFPKSPGKNSVPNWDCLNSIDMISMTNKVKSTIREIQLQPVGINMNRLLIIDGFLIFNYPPLAELCNLKYFISLSYSQCLARRLKRCYELPDPPGYFHNCVWPMFRLHLKEMQEQPYSKEIKYLDGNNCLEDNFDHILRSLRSLGIWQIHVVAEIFHPMP